MRRYSSREQDRLTSKFFIRTDITPTTALSGRNISEDSLASSTATLAAQYVVCQLASLSRTVVSSLGVLWVSENAELMERAIAVDEAASALGPFLDANSCSSSAGDEGVVAGNLGSRKRDMVVRAEGEINSILGLTTGMIGGATKALGTALGARPRPHTGLKFQSPETPP